MGWCNHSNTTIWTMHSMFLMSIATGYALYNCEMEYASMTIMCIAFLLPFVICSAISFWLPPYWVKIKISSKWGWIFSFQTIPYLILFHNRRGFYELKPLNIYDNKEVPHVILLKSTSHFVLCLVCFVGTTGNWEAIRMLNWREKPAYYNGSNVIL